MEIGTYTKIYNYRFWLSLTDSKLLKSQLDQMLRRSGYGIMNFSEHFFQPQGYTAMWLLSESHLALHTFPEEGRSYVELSGCSAEMNEQFVRLTHQEWKSVILEEQNAISG